MTGEELRAILAPNPTPFTGEGTWSYLVGRRRAAVVDPGPADARHLARLLAELREADSVTILLTHGHADHAGAAVELAGSLGAPIWAARGSLRTPLPTDRVDHWIGDGDELVTDAGPLRAVATPGHTPDHMAFRWHSQADDRGVLFAGDLLIGKGDTTLVAAPEGDVGAYLESLHRVERLDPRRIYPAHGPPLEDARGAVRRFRAHRLDRIDQVRRAITARPQAPLDDLVPAVYGTRLDPRLEGAAAGSIEAILRYLRAD